jgi:hypothetical protein
MTTVAEVLDDLVAGKLTLDQAVEDFRTRKWPPLASRATLEQALLGDEGSAPEPDSWEAVNADSRLTPDVYQQLAAAHVESMGDDEEERAAVGDDKLHH